MKMASRMNVPRLALVAALAALLSGCYAHGGGPYIAHYGGGYAYGGTYHTPPGHAYHAHRHHKPGLHRQARRHRSAARERDHRSEPTRRLEWSGQPRHDWNAETPRRDGPQVQRRRDPGTQAPRRDGRGSADRKAEPQPAPAEGYGRRAEWLPGPTARDEGPRPGAEGGAR